MALVDYVDTQQRLVALLEEKGRKTEYLYENLLRPTEDESDFDSLLREMVERNIIHKQYQYWHLVTTESEERRTNPKLHKEPAANSWAWYAWLPESLEFRQQIRARFKKEDARVFRALAAIIANERAPRLGSRTVGPITEKEGRYITQVNEALMAYVERMKQ